MRVGIFGGTFDPVHYGHLILAEQCRQQARLEEVLFVPAPRPPHKPKPSARFDQRVEMLALAVAGNHAFRIEEVEKERDGPSYTVDTLAELHQQRPGDELFLLIGGDTLRDFPVWHEPRRILELAGLIVVGRPGSPPPVYDDFRTRLRLPDSFLVRMEVVYAPLIEISSNDLRQRCAEGKSIRYLVPRAVECYVHDKRLYPSAAAST